MKIRLQLFAAFVAAMILATVAHAQFVIGIADPDGTFPNKDDAHFATEGAVATYLQAHSTAFNTLTVTSSTGTLTIANGKTLTASKTLTFTGTDGTTITCPATSATMARTDAANTGGLLSAAATTGIGYATGAGGAVTQATNRTTGVTLNKVCGQITTSSASLAAGANATFTVTDSAVAATDVIQVTIASGAVNVLTAARVTAVGAGSFAITIINGDGTTAETGAIVLNFAVIKAVAS